MTDGPFDLTGPPLSAFDFDAGPMTSVLLAGFYAFLLVWLIDFLTKRYFQLASAAAKFLIWLFFLLIVDQTLVIMGFKFRLPVWPSMAYAIIAAGLIGLALVERQSLQRLATAKGFFLPFVAIVVLAIVMYRGEAPGPIFGQMPTLPQFIASSRSYALWPALNLITCAALFVLAGRKELKQTIVLAAFVALIVQVVTMEADMWWPAIFGDANGRAGGLAQNANVAALLVVTLASLTLSTRYAPYAVMLALTGVLLSQSKAGGVAACVLAASFLFARPRTIDREAIFAGSIVLALAGTVMLSPVLNPMPEKIAEAASKPIIPNSNELPVATLDRPVTLEQRIEARTSVDESANLRWNAAKFFLGVVKEHPFGIGTGFTNRFVTGPHNSFLKLAADNGIIAAVLLLILLAGVTRYAVESRSPELITLSLVAWVSALFYHTFMVDPIVLPALAISLGSLPCATRSPAN
jgi:hypothetical protein